MSAVAWLQALALRTRNCLHGPARERTSRYPQAFREPEDVVESLNVSSGPHDGGPMAFAVRLSGDLDAGSAGRLSAEFDRLVSAGAKVLVVDCSEVSFIDSSGLRVLVAASKALEAADGQVFIEGMSATVHRILEITGLLDHYTRR